MCKKGAMLRRCSISQALSVLCIYIPFCVFQNGNKDLNGFIRTVYSEDF